MNVIARFFNWLGPQPITAVECRPAEAPLTDWKDLQARVFRNVPEAAHAAAIAEKGQVRYLRDSLRRMELDIVDPIALPSKKTAANRRGAKKPTKSKAKNVSRETSTAKRRKRSK